VETSVSLLERLAGRPTDDATDLQTTVRTIRQVKPGTELTLRIRRGEKEQDVKVKVGVLPFFLLD